MNNKVVNKQIALLGSTGSIGLQTIEAALHGGHKIHSIAGNTNIKLLEEQARKYQPVFCVAFDGEKARELKIKLADTPVEVLAGAEGLREICSREGVDIVVNAVSGQEGIRPTLAAIKAHKEIAIANKESLVSAGGIIMREAQKYKARLYPIDSEHSAVTQCIAGEKKVYIKNLILTASGGPFYGIGDFSALERATPEDVLKHPVWRMGAKISVDSATMMNKGLELIEACHLFGLLPDRVKVVIHRKGIVHSLVEFFDNSVKAQLSVPDMKLAILYALEGCRRKPGLTGELDLFSMGEIKFEKPDDKNFPLLEFARETFKKGGVLPAVMNTANEIAVARFLAGGMKFTEISEFVINNTLKHKNINIKGGPCLEDIEEAIAETKARLG